MGTSQSSDGSPPGVPMVPPWVPTPPPLDKPPLPTPDDQQKSSTPPPMPSVPLAPAGRFTGARKSLGGFARTGNAAAMRRGLGHYIRSGYGGAPTAANRFGGTAATANTLYHALS